MESTAPTDGPRRPEGFVPRLLHDLIHRRDRFRQLLGAVFCALVTWFGAPESPWFWIGAVLVVLGMSVRVWGSGIVHKNKLLATSGPYAWVRHPLYTGNSAIALGFCLCSWLWWSLPLWIVLYLLFYVPAIRYEDSKLKRFFPEEWPAWAGRTPAVLPGCKPATPDAPPASWTLSQSLFANGEPIYVVLLSTCLVVLHSRLL